jgi:hypothetical protein
MRPTTIPADIPPLLREFVTCTERTNRALEASLDRLDEPVQLAFDPAFDAMIERAEIIKVAGTSIAVVAKEDLIAMKRRAAADPSRRKSERLRDQADIELLLGDLPDPDEGW